MSNTDQKKVAVRVRIFGRVHGVFYRNWTKGEAEKLGLYGWVRNRTDGSVEALFVGPGPDVDEMLGLCHEGSPNASVDKIEIEAAKGITAERFDVKPTV
ncbi:acylphosphatase [Kordiimonas aestuarii]|uniref:acylphosphatase n=1 Tax=Kordiimonas aestuarii TaxID=1005925 RepID=UPI0021CFEEEC|nr:acylphosphatase [Kordiimonas aestuarii]